MLLAKHMNDMKHLFLISMITGMIFTSQSYAQTRNLEDYLNRAISNSPLLNDYNNRIGMTRLDSLIHRAEYKPQVDFSTTNIFAPAIKGYGYDRGIIDGGTYNALVTVSQTILGRRQLNAQLNGYRLDNRDTENSRQISIHDLRLSVIAQYITAYGTWQEMQYQQEVLNLMREEEHLLHKLMESAVYKQTDYLNFQIGVQQQSIRLQQQEATYRDAISTLNYLCGIVDTARVRLDVPTIALRLPAEYESTIQFKQSVIDSLRLRNEDLLIDYAYHPKVNVFIDGGFNTTFASQAYKNAGVSMGLSLSVPIYDGKQRKKQHSKIKLEEQTRQQYQIFARQQYQQQLAGLYQQLKLCNVIVEQSQTAVTQARTLMDAYRKLLRTGGVSITDYFLSVSSYLSLRSDVLQNTNAKLQIINQINYWNYEK